ncbi:hypothetical protein BH09PAT3_BH09PAT3_0620 [soil metagenome]
MTRILSELLQASEPHFRLQLGQLERASGHNNVDIKLSVEVVQAAKQKIRDLCLDQHDTTSEELYHALLERVSADDRRLERALRTRAATYVSAEADLTAGVLHALQDEAKGISGMGIKSATLKRLLKKTPPKRLLKTLGYRSLDAMLRHESPILLAAAAQNLESAAWRRTWNDAYKQLRPADFESHALQVLSPTDRRWQSLTDKMITEHAHTVLVLPEMSAIILLPLPASRPSGMVVATMAFALHELNTIAAAGNYLRASQVHGDFGIRVQAVASGRVQLEAPFMPQAMPWHLVQQYFATTKAAINEDIFGPYVQSADFYWHNVEQKLEQLCPSMAFWQNTNYLTLLQEGQAVSMNIVDAAINCCNQVRYESRSAYHAQQALWSELTLRYLDHTSIEQAVASVLHPQLALETAVSE